MGFLTNFFGKIAGSAAGGFFVAYKMWFIVGLVAALGAGVTYYVYTAEKAKSQVEILNTKLENIRLDYASLIATVEFNEAALKVCLDINKQNAAALKRQETKIQEGLLAVKLLQAESRHTVEDIQDEAEELRGVDTECRTADEPLPDWLIAGLCDTSPENCHRL